MKHIINWKGAGEYIVSGDQDGITVGGPQSYPDCEMVNFPTLESVVLYCAPVAGTIEVNIAGGNAFSAPQTVFEESLQRAMQDNTANRQFYQFREGATGEKMNLTEMRKMPEFQAGYAAAAKTDKVERLAKFNEIYRKSAPTSLFEDGWVDRFYQEWENSSYFNLYRMTIQQAKEIIDAANTPVEKSI